MTSETVPSTSDTPIEAPHAAPEASESQPAAPAEADLPDEVDEIDEGDGVPSEPGDMDESTAEGEAAPAAEEKPADNKQWYIVKVQSNREDSIKRAIERRVKIEGLEDCFGQIVIPVEKVTEIRKNNKRYIKERKLLPGYFMAYIEFNDRILYLFRETPGVGDFVGAGLNKAPEPMPKSEIDKWIGRPEGEASKEEAVKPKYNEGDRVRVKDGTFSGMEGVVKQLNESKGTVSVELMIFGRPVPVELEYWQVDFA
jgi:transcriptional antiterminator NusG